jgi:hypothetical protein
MIGWCRPISDTPLMRKLGLDFVEVALAPLGLERIDSFTSVKRAVAASALPTAAFNNFLPQSPSRAKGRMVHAPRKALIRCSPLVTLRPRFRRSSHATSNLLIRQSSA